MKIFDQKKYEGELIPQLGAIWSNVLKFRDMEEGERMFNAGKLKTVESIKIPFDTSRISGVETQQPVAKQSSPKKISSPKRSSITSGKATVRKPGKAALAAEANMQLIDSILENINLESL